MAKNQLRSSELKKHVGAIHIRNRLTLLQRKVANILLLNAYENLLEDENHSISVKRLSDIAGFDSKDLETLKRALTSLAETAIEWNLLDEKGKDVWRVSSMLAEAEITGGECRYAYSRMLRQKLFNPEVYARINLAIQRRFSSGHALALYENCARFRSTGSTGWWELLLFRRLMGIEDKEYLNFKDLNKRVIKPAIEQINKQSDILIEVEYKREKRRVVALKFIVKDNPQLPLRLTVKEQILSSMENGLLIDAPPSSPENEPPQLKQSPETADPPPVKQAAGNVKFTVLEPVDEGHDREKAFERLQQFGLGQRDAKRWLNDKGVDYTLENLDIVERDYRAGKVKNLPAYTTAALRDDFRPRSITLAEEDAPARRQESDIAEAQKQAHDTLDALERDFQRTRLDAALDQVSDNDRTALEKDFWDNYWGNPLLKKFRKQGLQHPVVHSVFLAYARERLLANADESALESGFVEFAAAQGKNLNELRQRAGRNCQI